MKNLYTLFIIVFCSVGMAAQTGPIFSALNSGDAAGLERYLDERVEIVIDNKPSFMTKKQASKAIESFFSRVKVNSCKEIHQGSSKNKDSKYTIGQLLTNDGEYRVYMFIQKSGNASLIQEIRFDKS
jgi:hypothetical protein